MIYTFNIILYKCDSSNNIGDRRLVESVMFSGVAHREQNRALHSSEGILSWQRPADLRSIMWVRENMCHI